jgi:hypothetical protein
MKKIAFLFLTLDNPNFPKIWNSYFRGHTDKYSLYIHPKYIDKVTWKKKNVIGQLKETEWGFITRAYIELMKEAYKDVDNYKFVTISESCIPIKSFDKFYEDCVMNDPRSWIKSMKMGRYNYQGRLDLVKTLPKPKYFIKNYARFCLNREHVRLLLLKNNEGKMNFFHNMQVGDEYFLSVLYPLKNVRDFAVTYDDWEYIDNKKRIIKDKQLTVEKYGNEWKKLQNEYNLIAKSPKTIVNVTVDNDLEKIKKCDSYFYRKFSKDSNIQDYWKHIIKDQ